MPGLPDDGARWTSPCCPFSETDFSAGRKPRRCGGATRSCRRTARRVSTCAGPRRIRRRRARSCTSVRRPPRPWWPSCRGGGVAVVDPSTPVFGLSASQIGRRVNAAAKAPGLGDGFTGHSGRVGMAQDLAASGVELPALMTAGRWKSSKMPARYIERQAAGRGAVARNYQQRGKSP